MNDPRTLRSTSRLTWPAKVLYPSRAFLGVGLASLSLGACDSCKNDHPYVPYSIGGDSGAPSAVPGADAAASIPPEPSRPTAGDLFERAPAMATTWNRDSVTLRAPDGTHFERGAFDDFDGDGKRDAFCVVRSFASPKTFDALYFSGASPDSPVRVFGAELLMLPKGAGRHTLLRVGPPEARRFSLELSAEPSAAFAETRRFAFLEIVKGLPRVRLAFTVTDPPGAPKLALSVDAADRDGDAVPDVTLMLSVQGGSGEPGPSLSSKIAFLDRPAGLARDADEPRASLAAHVKVALAKSSKSKEASEAVAMVGRIQALVRATCPELPGARLSRFEGVTDPSCSLRDVLDDLSVAEVRGYAQSSRPFSAAAAFARFRGPFVARAPEKVREAEKALDSVAKVTAPREVRSVSAAVVAPKRHVPSWSPLAFTPKGELDVSTATRIVRVDPKSFEERDLEESPWTSGVLSADGETRLVEVYDACKGGPLRATFAPKEEGEPHDVEVPVEPALVPPCTSSRGEPAEVMPVGWGPRGLLFFAAGEPVLVDPKLTKATLLAEPIDGGWVRGGPRSPDGKTVALATSAGVIVRGPGGTLRVRGPGFSDDVRNCTVNDDASALACLVGGRAVLALLR